MMLQENELCLIIVTISSFNQQVLHLRLGAEAFLINALIDSPVSYTHLTLPTSDLV